MPLSTTCVTKHSTNDHDNEHGKDEHKVGSQHALALLMYEDQVRADGWDKFLDLDSPETAKKGNDGDDGGNDNDDVGCRSVEADVKFAV